VYTVDGEVNLENSGVRPDIEVENTPDDLSAGVDAQLNRAVATLLEEIEPRRPATPPTMPAKPAETPTSTPAPVPAKPAETPSTGKPTTAPSGR
jgi:tricorn protease